MKGVPIRLEIGPRDIAQNQCVAVARDNRKKVFIALDRVAEEVPVLLDALHDRMLERAEKSMRERIYDVEQLEAFGADDGRETRIYPCLLVRFRRVRS